MIDIKLEDLKTINKELINKILNEVDGDSGIDDSTIEVEGKTYGFKIIDNTEWQDDGRGKYFFKEYTGLLCLYDDDYNIVEEYNVISTQGISRSGSYYTDWNYEYETPTYNQACKEVIPEQIIPEHVIIGFKALER